MDNDNTEIQIEPNNSLIDSLSIISRDSQMSEVLKSIGIDSNEVIGDGKVSPEEIVDMTVKLGNAALDLGVAIMPEEHEIGSALSEMEKDFPNHNVVDDITPEDARAIGAVYSIRNNPEAVFNLMDKIKDQYCKESGDEYGLCRSFTAAGTADEPLEGVEKTHELTEEAPSVHLNNSTTSGFSPAM